VLQTIHIFLWFGLILVYKESNVKRLGIRHLECEETELGRFI